MTAIVKSGEAPNRLARRTSVESVCTQTLSPATAPPTRMEDLTPGLLLFFSRPSRLQSWAEFWGQPFRHVGITVQTAKGVRVASYSASQCYRLDDLADLMPNYDRIAVASVGANEGEQQAISEWCASFENLDRKDAPYTKSAVLIGPLMEIARRRGGVVRRALLVILVAYCKLEDCRDRRRPSFVCSTFVWRALVECTDNRVRIPMTAHPSDQAAYATPVTPIDELLARWFCAPGDLWRGISEANRSELELDHMVGQVVSDPRDDLVIDLRDGAERDDRVVQRVTSGQIDVVIDLRDDPKTGLTASDGHAGESESGEGRPTCKTALRRRTGTRRSRAAISLVRAALFVATHLFAGRLLEPRQ